MQAFSFSLRGTGPMEHGDESLAPCWRKSACYWVARASLCGGMSRGGNGRRGGTSSLCHEHYKTEALSALELVPRKVAIMCYMQDAASDSGPVKMCLLFFPTDAIAEVMCLEWVSTHHNRKMQAGQISRGDFFDATQVPAVLSIALRRPLRNRSRTSDPSLTQQCPNLSGLVFWAEISTHACNYYNLSKFSLFFILYMMNFRDWSSTLNTNFYHINSGSWFYWEIGND